MSKLFCLFLFLINYLSIFSQNVEINYNLLYTFDNGKKIICSVSSQNSSILLLDHLQLKQRFLYFNEYISTFSMNNNGEINYKNLDFRLLNYNNKNSSIQLIETNETKVDDYNCTKYTIKVDCDRIYEIFITKHEIDNTMLIYFDIPTKIKSIFKPGLVVKVNSRNETDTNPKNLFNLEKIEEIKNNMTTIDTGEIKRKISLKE